MARGWMMGLALCLATCGAHAQSRFAFDTTPGKLPKDVVPSEYRLALGLDPARETFDGAVDIAIKVRRPVEAIVLAAYDLSPLGVSLEGASDVRPMAVAIDEPKREWRIDDGRAIEPGDYRLRILYSGHAHSYADGLYRVLYTAEGKPAKMLATQMEPIYARMVFPGFDEPSFRARFSIKVVAPSEYEVVSNMPVRQREPQGAMTRWQFDTTPPMASYLVAVAVGQFDALEDTVDGIPLRILTAKGKKESARYAMESTKQVLSFYREYFGIPFTLPKLDQLAIPGTRFGAMEDWGAISYVESALLYDPEKSSIRTKRASFQVMSHEVAHQWFGDLVTAASWDEIWLNEAFATWMEQKATQRFNRDWQSRLDHYALWQQGVMREDAGGATRAIRSGPVVETAVFDVFDGVTYAKGGAVLEMLETYLGRETFRRGLNAYFDGQKMSNATAGDLWYYLGQASGKDVAAIARSWTDQEGHPLIDVRAACVDGKRMLTLEQHRFRNDGKEDATMWKVPLAVNGTGTEPARLLLTERKQDFAIGPCARAPVYIDSTAGFFRVQYAPELRQSLAKSFASLPASERMALLGDTFALAQAGRVPLADYLSLAASVKPAADTASQALYIQVVDALSQLDVALAGTPAYPQLRSFARQALGPMLAKIGWEPSASETEVTRQLRESLIRVLGRFHDEPTLRKSAQLFAAERKGGPAVDATIRRAVIGNVARTANRETYEELVRRLASADRVEDRTLYSSALGYVENADLAKRFLALSLEDTLPPEIAGGLPQRLALGVVHGDLAYAFVRDHYEALGRKTSEWERAYMLPNAAASFSDAERAATLLADQKRLAGAHGDKAAREEAADIELRSRVRARNGASLGIEAQDKKS